MNTNLPVWLDLNNFSDSSLNEFRNDSKKKLIDSRFPSNKIESWRLANLKKLRNFINLPYSSTIQNSLLDSFPSLKKESKNVFQIICDPLNSSLSSKKLPKGIEFIDENEIKKILTRNYSKKNIATKSWSTLINSCSIQKIIGLRINGNNLPLIELLIPGASNSFNSTRFIFFIEQNSNVKINQIIIGSETSAQSNIVQLFLDENSTVEHGYVALGGGDGNLLAKIAVEQKKLSKYSLTSLQHGWSFSRLEPKINQLEGQANSLMKCLQISKGYEQVSTHSYVCFDGPEGELDQLNKSSANDNSHSIFNGAIEVPRIAQKTQAAQLSRNLILSKRAQIDTKPELEIIADDVRCTHGATVSQLQEDELFYLRSRGIGSKQANSLLLEGYYHEILSNLPHYNERLSFLNNFLSKYSI